MGFVTFEIRPFSSRKENGPVGISDRHLLLHQNFFFLICYNGSTSKQNFLSLLKVTTDSTERLLSRLWVTQIYKIIVSIKSFFIFHSYQKYLSKKGNLSSIGHNNLPHQLTSEKQHSSLILKWGKIFDF